MSDFKAKMHQIQFPLGLAPDPAGGAYSVPLIEGAKGGRREEVGKKREGKNTRD